MWPSGPRPSRSRSSSTPSSAASSSSAASAGSSSPRIRCTSRGCRLEPVEQRLLREPVVRALVVRRHAALVAPPEARPCSSRARSSAARSYAAPGAEPPVSTIEPPRPAWSASRSPTGSRGIVDDLQLRLLRHGQGYETAVEPGKEVHAREPGPLAVGGEQRVGLLGLDPAPPERRGELRRARGRGRGRTRSGRGPRGRSRRPTTARGRALG